MTGTDEDVYARAVVRISRIAEILTLAGVAVTLATGRWTWAAGFALGAAVSWLNFRWLKQLVEALGSKRPRPALALLSALRYLFLGGGAYVIVKYTPVNSRAAVAGLLVVVPAALIVAIIELVHAGRVKPE